MTRIRALIIAATMLLGTSTALADTLTATLDDQAVLQVMNEFFFGDMKDVRVVWAADANLAGTLIKTDAASPLLVKGINPDGSMSLSTAVQFIANLNAQAYLGITNWRLPTTYSEDLSCSFTAATTNTTFGYHCAEALFYMSRMAPLPTPNPSYVYSELGALFNALGGKAHASIKDAHNDRLQLFTNVQAYLYWSQTAQPNNGYFGNDFWFQNGFEGTENQYDSIYVLPVATVTGAPPAPTPMTPACAVVLTSSCTKPILADLGVTSNLGPSKPTLQISPDGALVYDPTLNVVFLRDANLAASLPADSPYRLQRFNKDGSMSAKTLAHFLAALNDRAQPYMGLMGWTVPMISPDGVNGDCSIVGEHGAPDYGYNCDHKPSEAGELFYDELGGVPGQDIARSPLAKHYFHHLESSYYWQCQPTKTDPPGECQVDTGGGEPSFSFRSGYQGSQIDPNDLFVLLELPADAIPIAQQWWLYPPPSRPVEPSASRE
jgi:hypothetical protein